MSKHIVAVSGGIDSMALLHMCRYQWFDDAQYIIAHVNHGIRKDGSEDEALVAQIAKDYGFTFVSTNLALPTNASEETARMARYEWLLDIKKRYDAIAIITAHHQDDVLETIVINCIRGTGWRGLLSLKSHVFLKRPLLSMSKVSLCEYAISHSIQWREDSTNQDMSILRNNIRATVMRRIDTSERKKLVSIYQSQIDLDVDIQKEIDKLYSQSVDSDGLSRYRLIMYGPEVAYEIVSRWLDCSLTLAQRQRLHRFIATARPSSSIELGDGLTLAVTTRQLVVYH